MDEPRIDLGALDPDAEPGAEGRFVDGVMALVSARTTPALHLDPLIGVWSIMRSPALAAGIVIAVAIGALGLRLTAAAQPAPTTIAEAMGVPVEFLASAPSSR